MATAKTKPAVAKKTASVKTVAGKSATKTVKAEVKNVVAKETGLSVTVLGVDGKAAGSMTLPEAYFGAKVNKQLVSQAVRVYLANQRAGTASTKTRGEVEGSTKKIYKQKHTGRARHGAIRAPIFVGGGIVFGPRPKDYSLNMPQKMKKAALVSAMTEQFKRGNITVVSGLAGIEPKTKNVAAMLTAIGAMKRTLLVVGSKSAETVRAGRNIEKLDIVPVSDLYAYTVVTHSKIVFMKEAISELK